MPAAGIHRTVMLNESAPRMQSEGDTQVHTGNWTADGIRGSDDGLPFRHSFLFTSQSPILSNPISLPEFGEALRDVMSLPDMTATAGIWGYAEARI